MTTYYGVWSDWSGRNGKEWWHANSGELFCTTFLPVALAQVMVSNAIWKRGPAYGTRKDERWEVRTIGEDGLPVTRQQWQHITEDQKRIRSEAASHKCELCDKVATNWIELPRPYRAVYFCDRHEVWGTLFLGPFPLFERREL